MSLATPVVLLCHQFPRQTARFNMGTAEHCLTAFLRDSLRQRQGALRHNRITGEPNRMTIAPTVTLVSRDFFVSYTSVDRAFAEWIAHDLEDAGHSVFIQAWDIRPGHNFVLKMHDAARSCIRTVAVVSEAYLQAMYTQPEWATAFAVDALGSTPKLIPVRVTPCDLDGLWKAIVYIDLVGVLDASERRIKLLDGIDSSRAKPKTRPPDPWLARTT